MNLQSTRDVLCVCLPHHFYCPGLCFRKSVKQFVSLIAVPECTRDQPKGMIWHGMCCKDECV